MATIVIQANSFPERKDQIRRLLRRLTLSTYGPPPVQGTGGSRTIVLGAHQGPSELSFRQWRFPLKVQHYVANYFEQWRELNGGSYALIMLCLNIYWIDERENTEREYVSLHAEPSLDRGAPGNDFKAGPH